MIAPSWPHPPTWGFATRVYQLARQLARRHRVSFLAFGGGDVRTATGPAAAFFDSIEFVPPPDGLGSKRLAQARSLFSSRSHHLGGLRSGRMEEALRVLTSRHRFDLIQIESSQMGFLLPIGAQGVPVVLDEHNVEFMLLRRLTGVESSIPRRLFAQIEAAKARREEATAWSGADGVVFTSDADRAVMSALQPEKLARVVPNGVDVDFFQPSGVAPEPATVVFSGAINYRPNTDAVAYFMRRVMPRLKRLRPSTRFVVVGQGAPEWLVRMADASTQFTGAVPDVRPYLAMASVVVAPLRAGSGTRLKILEALAMGKPVVTTTIGCEGLATVDGQHLRVADDPDAFAEATAQLMSDQTAATELGARGRALVARDYSWEAVASRLEEFHSVVIRKEATV
jgi:glycosyltransferase involved in cell wall biosynthesis